jgi:hypothetical protein
MHTYTYTYTDMYAYAYTDIWFYGKFVQTISQISQILVTLQIFGSLELSIKYSKESSKALYLLKME